MPSPTIGSRRRWRGPDGSGPRPRIGARRPAGSGDRDRCRLLDRHADQAAVLGPAAVVVADPLVAEQLVQDEPAVAGALADAAVGDDVLVGGHADVAVDPGQLLVGLEGAVLAGRGGPGHVGRPR